MLHVAHHRIGTDIKSLALIHNVLHIIELDSQISSQTENHSHKSNLKHIGKVGDCGNFVGKRNVAVEVFNAAVKFGNIVDVDHSDTGLWIYVLSHKLTMTKDVCFEEILMQI